MTRIELIKNMYRHDFSSFNGFAFQALYPHMKYHDNWHIHALAEVLSRAERGEVQRLIINMPPRMLKSFCASVSLPAWILGRDPHKKILCLHSGNTLGQELHESCLRLITNPRYMGVFDHMAVAPQSRRFSTSFGGGRQYMSIHEPLTGLGADYIIVDDPISTMDAQNEHERRRLNGQFDQNILQRLNNKKSGVIILVMQRLHEHDLSAHLLAKNEGWELISMPAIAMQDETWKLPRGQIYIRKKGEPLHKERETHEQLADILRSIGGYPFAYQYLQGQYKTKFGEAGEGGVWLEPTREGEFYDMYDSPQRPQGLFRMNEIDFMLPRIFNIGEDPIPANAREPTMEEVLHNAKRNREVMLEHQRKVASGELDF